MSYFKRATLPLKTPRESTLPPSEVYILHFINPFHEKYSHLQYEYKRKYFARNKILRLFKSEPISKKVLLQETTKLSKERTTSEAFSFSEEQVSQKLIYPNLSSVIKKSLPWITEPLSKKNKNDTISKKEFNLLMITIVLNTIKELGFDYKFVKSRSEEDMYVKIFAKEDVLKEHANRMNYRLKFRKRSYWDQGFQRVPPFGPIWIADEKEDESHKNFFVKYDEYGNETTDNGSLFTFTDKYRIVYNVISQKMDLHILKGFDILINNFVPHENGPLKQLKEEWASFKNIAKPQPIDKIKTYFSEQVAFYFCWIETYKMFMTVAAIAGLITFSASIFSYFTDHSQIALIFEIGFCLFLAVWAVTFEQYWIRKEKTLAWEWGTLNFGEQQIQREDFKGIYAKDQVTGRMKTVKSDHIKYNSIKIFSFSTILMFVSLVIAVIISVFMLRISMLQREEWKSKAPLVTAIIYAVQINIFDVIYTLVAKYLTIWENHETMNEYNNSFALKLFMFRFVNTYSGLFYTAFFKEKFEGKCGFEGCLSELGFQLSIIFIVNIVLNIIELGLPVFLYKFRETKDNIALKKKNSSSGITTTSKDPAEIERESNFEPYDYAIEDYMEMCLQYGFVVIFGASFPLIPIFALLEIYIEIRIDAIKLCKFLRRPEPVKTEDIGIWKKIILFITLFGVFSNSGIIIITTNLLDNYQWQDKFTIFIIFEHILLLVIVILRYLIPDTPEIVLKGTSWAKRILVDKMAGKNELLNLEDQAEKLMRVNRFSFNSLSFKNATLKKVREKEKPSS